MKTNKLNKNVLALSTAVSLALGVSHALALDVPGKIEAENASSQTGTRTLNTSDVGGGRNVGNISNGDSLSFNVNVESSGNYTLQLRVASPRDNASVSVRVNGSAAASLSVPNTNDWQNWETIETEIALDAGNQTLELRFAGSSDGDIMNINWLNTEFLGGSVVSLQKRGTAFSVDGNRGAIQGQEVYLWSSESNNANQQWVETSQGGSYYSYQKNNTSLCLDGGSGAALRQPITLQPCNDADQDQHWEKVKLSNGSYRFAKRGTNYSIDGNNGAESLQGIYLWTSSDNNVNQQWQLSSADGGNTETTTPSTPISLPSDYELISSISDLHAAFGRSNTNFKMAPGHYTVTDVLDDRVTILRTTGSNNTFDFTGVTIDIPTSTLSKMSGAVHTYAEWKVEGNNNTFVNGTFINSYADGAYSVTDFKTHNDNSAFGRSPGGSSTFMRIWGDRNQFINNKIEVRGSYPYGYGEIYGKGSGNTFGQKKHSGIQIVGDDTIIDGLDLTQLAFGHGIFLQGADNTTIRNSKLQGEMRLGADMYNDGAGSLPDQSDYQLFSPDWRAGPIPKNKMFALTEDGIRAYSTGTKLNGDSASTGSVVVENTSVTNLRSCIALVSASDAYVNNVDVRGCEDAFSVPSGGEVVNSSADAAFGHLIGMPYGNENNGTFDITLVEADYQTGDHYLTNIAGSGHKITIRSDGNQPSINRPIKVGYAWDRWDVTGDTDRHGARDITIINETEHDLDLTKYSSGIDGSSVGDVIDSGTNNDVD